MEHFKFVAFLAYRALVGLLTMLALPFLVVLALVAGATLALTEWIADTHDEFKARSKKEGDS